MLEARQQNDLLRSHSHTLKKWIFDVGFHNGNDSYYYLKCGYSVVAVEANPVLVEEGLRRFSLEIATGDMILMNAGIWRESGSQRPFYVNDTDSGWSSFVPELGQRGGKYHIANVPVVTVGDLFSRYGNPWYLKVDIEGADEAVLSGLTNANAPRYFSCELRPGSSALETLYQCGYRGFKLINQETFTQSLPIFDDQVVQRALRKLSVLLPPFKSAISSLPTAVRPKNIMWDTFREQFAYRFPKYSSGPFGEDTEGRWLSFQEMSARLRYLFGRYSYYRIEENFWFDLHARLGTEI